MDLDEIAASETILTEMFGIGPIIACHLIGVTRHAGAHRTTHRTTAYRRDQAIRNGTYALVALDAQIAGSALGSAAG